MDTTYILLAAILGIVTGYLIGYFLKKNKESKITESATKQAESILREAKNHAENIKKNKTHEAKEHFLKLKEQFEEEANRKKKIILNNEQTLKQKEASLRNEVEQNQRLKSDFSNKKELLDRQLEATQQKQLEFETMKSEQIAVLEKYANLSAENAKEEMVKLIKDEAETQASSHIKKVIEEAKLSANKEAKKIVISTIQRTATEHSVENSVSVFNIDNDAIKGKIIGREGRNIRALESATGVEFIVDDTPEAIIISGFDPVRREVARLSLHRLVQDGRIHPAKIEEVVNKTKKNIDEEIVEIGERTVIDLGIHGLHPELIKMVGRMRFRSSYAQNLLQHSRETANLCSTMAAELGLDVKQAKRAGLLHDIGKVLPDESEKPHAIAGMELAQKYKENKEVCNAIGAHHDEIEMTSLISPIVQVCDAISGSRPGARREMMAQYIKRLKNLEELALEFDGVIKCYAIQAGRELRVFVDAEKIDDNASSNLSFKVSQKIEKEMQYPGQVKITVIRETRAVSYAK